MLKMNQNGDVLKMNQSGTNGDRAKMNPNGINGDSPQSNFSALRAKKAKLKINIPENLTEEQLKELREFIKTLGQERPNTDVIIVNKNNAKTLRLLMNETVIEELVKRIGKSNLEWVEES